MVFLFSSSILFTVSYLPINTVCRGLGLVKGLSLFLLTSKPSVLLGRFTGPFEKDRQKDAEKGPKGLAKGRPELAYCIRRYVQ